MNIIESPQNEVFKELKKLLSSRGIDKQQKAIVSGSKLTAEALKNSRISPLQWIMTEAQRGETHTEMQRLDHRPVVLSNELFRELDQLGTNAPLLLIKPLEIKVLQQRLERPAVWVATGDPQNLGSIARSALAFGFKDLVLLKEACHPLLQKSMKASSGALLNLTLWSGPSIKDLSKEEGKLTKNNLVCLDMKGEDVRSFTWPSNPQFLVGEEGLGLPAELRIQSVKIPMSTQVESLNAAVALSLVLYSFSIK